MNVTVVDFGTYCDFKIVSFILSALVKRGYRVVHVTDDDNRLSDSKKLGVHRVVYFLPDSWKKLLKHPANINRISDSYTSSVSKFFSHGNGLIAFYLFLRAQKQALHDVWEQSDRILLHYPAIPFLATMPQRVVQATPFTIFLVAPAYPNRDIPWVFDSRLSETAFRLFNDRDTVRENNLRSTVSLLRAIPGMSASQVWSFLRSARLAAMWDPQYLPMPESPLHVVNIGALVDRPAIKTSTLPSKVRTFVEAGGRTVYISIGSFQRDISPVLLAMLSTGFRVIFHDTQKRAEEMPLLREISSGPKEALLVYPKFISHEAIVPCCRYVVTTGSICLVNVALYHGIPLLFIPMLNEQYMWAKNFQMQCGVPYVDYRLTFDEQWSQTLIALNSLKASKVTRFMERVQKSMQSSDGVQNLLKMLEE